MRDDEDHLPSGNLNKWKNKEKNMRDDEEGRNSRRWYEEITNKNKWNIKKKK